MSDFYIFLSLQKGFFNKLEKLLESSLSLAATDDEKTSDLGKLKNGSAALKDRLSIFANKENDKNGGNSDVTKAVSEVRSHEEESNKTNRLSQEESREMEEKVEMQEAEEIKMEEDASPNRQKKRQIIGMKLPDFLCFKILRPISIYTQDGSKT